MPGLPFPVVYDQLLCLADIEEEVVVMASHCQVTYLLPIHCFIITVVSSANLMMVLVVCGHTVVGERRVQ
jgi:hypothetical protein